MAFGDGFRQAIEQERAHREREAAEAQRIAERMAQQKLEAEHNERAEALRRQTQELKNHRIWREMGH